MLGGVGPFDRGEVVEGFVLEFVEEALEATCCEFGLRGSEPLTGVCVRVLGDLNGEESAVTGFDVNRGGVVRCEQESRIAIDVVGIGSHEANFDAWGGDEGFELVEALAGGFDEDLLGMDQQGIDQQAAVVIIEELIGGAHVLVVDGTQQAAKGAADEVLAGALGFSIEEEGHERLCGGPLCQVGHPPPDVVGKGLAAAADVLEEVLAEEVAGARFGGLNGEATPRIEAAVGEAIGGRGGVHAKAVEDLFWRHSAEPATGEAGLAAA